jgi:hypothetical protein
MEMCANIMPQQRGRIIPGRSNIDTMLPSNTSTYWRIAETKITLCGIILAVFIEILIPNGALNA